MQKCVFLADDNAIVRRSLRTVFESAGFSVCGEASDGAQAVERAPSSHPDLIVLDLSMPTMNGLQAAPLLRKKLPEVPIILFTMFAGTVMENHARASGVSTVVSKDRPIRHLVEQARKLMGEKGQA